MTQNDFAEKLGITQGYLSRIYNCKATPSWELAQKWRSIFRKSYDWWMSAKISERQRVFNRILKTD